MAGDEPEMQWRPDGGLLSLRSFGPDDVGLLQRASDDGELRRWNPLPGGSREAVTDWYGQRNDWTGGHHRSWAVAGPDGDLVGSVSIYDISRVHGSGSVGYWTVPWARRTGVATGALRLVADAAFGPMGLRRLALLHAVENVGSCGVAEAAGFRLEGLTRQSYVYGDGVAHDEHIHGRLAVD